MSEKVEHLNNLLLKKKGRLSEGNFMEVIEEKDCTYITQPMTLLFNVTN